MAFADEGRTPEVVPMPPSPMTARLEQFRHDASSPDRPLETEEETPPIETEPEGEEQEEQVETPEGEEQEEQADTDAGTGADEGAEAEGEEKPQAEAAATKTFEVAIPTLAPGRHGVLMLEGLPQEYRDTIQAHVKRSLQLGESERQLQELEPLRTLAEFYRHDPLNAMRQVALDRNDVAQDFVQEWMVQNPKVTVQLMRRLKLDSADEEILTTKAELARQKMDGDVAAAWNTVSTRASHARYTARAQSTIRDVIAPLALSADEVTDFMGLAEQRVVREMERATREGRSPLLPMADIVALVQPLVQRFFTPPGGGQKKAAGKPGKQSLERRAQVADKFRKLGGRAGASVTPGAVRKTKLPRDLGERIKLLRQGKI